MAYIWNGSHSRNLYWNVFDNTFSVGTVCAKITSFARKLLIGKSTELIITQIQILHLSKYVAIGSVEEGRSRAPLSINRAPPLNENTYKNWRVCGSYAIYVLWDKLRVSTN